MTKGDMAVSKVFSAQWLMSVLVTLACSLIALAVVWKRQEYATVVIPLFFSNWGIIITNYFKRDTSNDLKITPKEEVKPV